jgi:peptidoglycan/xylan/chitin deacetylase (PgdA/CDA1 family)
MVHRDVIVFLYHVVSDDQLPHIRHIYPYKTPAAFEQDLLYLKKHFQLVGYDGLVEYRTRAHPIRLPLGLLTFDDGFQECYSVIRPLLLQHNIPAVFFITTDLLDNRTMLFRNKVSLCIEKMTKAVGGWQAGAFERLSKIVGKEISSRQDFIAWVKSLQPADQERLQATCHALEVDVVGYLKEHQPYLTSDQVCDLASDGFTIGAHSLSHTRLNRLSPGDVEREIVESCRIVAHLSHEAVVPFSFPFSAHRVERDFLADVLARNPIVGLLFDTKGLIRDREFILSRIWADPPGEGAQSNLPDLLYWAYQKVLLSQMNRFGINT